MSLSDVIKTALDQINYIAKTETVIGEPIRAGNVTLIPVSRVSIGFAAGGAGDEKKSGSGVGTGGGVSVTPVAFISIIDDKVQDVCFCNDPDEPVPFDDREAPDLMIAHQLDGFFYDDVRSNRDQLILGFHKA